MKLKELYKKYKDYTILVWGKSKSDKDLKLKDYIKTRSPWSGVHTTNKREIDNMEVVEYFIEDKEEKSFVFNTSFEFKRIEVLKGTVYVLVTEGEK